MGQAMFKWACPEWHARNRRRRGMEVQFKLQKSQQMVMKDIKKEGETYEAYMNKAKEYRNNGDMSNCMLFLKLAYSKKVSKGNSIKHVQVAESHIQLLSNVERSDFHANLTDQVAEFIHEENKARSMVTTQKKTVRFARNVNELETKMEMQQEASLVSSQQVEEEEDTDTATSKFCAKMLEEFSKEDASHIVSEIPTIVRTKPTENVQQ